jgi:hypothetical protein
MNQTIFNLAKETIRNTTLELLSPDDPANDKVREAIIFLLNCIEESYCLVQWPESQDYMGEEWFREEAILVTDKDDVFGGSAYMIPTKRIIQ